MKVYEVLERLEQEGPYNPDLGICNNLKFEDAVKTKELWAHWQFECFHAWEEFSGSEDYPVPSTSRNRSPATAFNCTSRYGMWSTETSYGQARWRLLDHCIKWFKERDL